MKKLVTGRERNAGLLGICAIVYAIDAVFLGAHNAVVLLLVSTLNLGVALWFSIPEATI